MRSIATIGYEGATIEAFIQTLSREGVDLLLDIREYPVSRKKGFSKRALSEALGAAGIDYRHERALGSPRDMRHRLRSDRDYRRFFLSYERYLETQNALVSELASALHGHVALMCYEKNWLECHRKSVARALAHEARLKPRHLRVRADGEGTAPAGACMHPGQGVPAA